MRVVINKCYGGFSLSNKAMKTLLALKSIEFTSRKGLCGREFYHTDGRRIFLEGLFKTELALRTDPDLIQVVTTLGEKSWGSHAQLAIIEIPDGIEITVEEYDGVEWVAEVHRKWY